jgi:biopolymer transport protein ExbD
MSKFKKDGKKKLPAISTASLPDIIFMLLFFFMVATVMREVTLIVQVKAPDASEVQKLEDKSLVSFIYIGKPTKALQKKWGDEDRIQLNDAFAEVSEIRGYVEEKLTKIPEYKRKKHMISMKVDADAKMGIVTDVKQELRKANALKINYSTRKGYDAKK